MTEWTVVGVIGTLIGLMAAVSAPTISLIRAITKLTAAVERLDEKHSEMRARNSKAHDALFATQREHDARLDDHETRITVIEKKE